ncbi:rho GTPase-activating protein 1-like [Oncorhynchus keta]|uniref:rho GTPase-activating protein 1-like n=1 Tax=Oncorhynchus keta TaxID=8018 RepID=UPI00227C03E4|nr:rho GTPase-activating protein 1-like [Oncorhynchus keta]
MISSTDLEQLAEIELQKEEDEEQGRHGYRPDRPPAPRRVSFSQDTSHPYYDVARHGILQVTGDDNYGRKLVIFSSCLMPPPISSTTTTYCSESGQPSYDMCCLCTLDP